MVFINTYRHFIWHKSHLNISCLLCYFRQLLLLTYLGPDFLEIDLLVFLWFLKVSRDFLVYVFRAFFWFLEGRKESDGIQSEVPHIDEVQHHDLAQKHHVWYSTIICLVHQHLVQDRDLVQHHDLEPQEEQS